MIRRPRKTYVATDVPYSTQLRYSGYVKGELPATCVALGSSVSSTTSSTTTTNGYFHNNSITGSVSIKQSPHHHHHHHHHLYNFRRTKTLSTKQKRWISRICAVIAYGTFIYCCGSLYLKTPSRHTTRSKQSRRTTRTMDTSNKDSYTIILPPQRFPTMVRKFAVPKRTAQLADDDTVHDFGDLELRFLTKEAFQGHGRVINHDNNEDIGYDELWDATDDDGDMESYYAFDDDEKRNPLVMYDDPDIHLRKQCRRTNWHRELPISCNAIHDYDFQSTIRMGDTKYLGHGYYRTVFLTTTPQNESLVVKMLNWDYDFAYDDFEYMRMDAIVNEKLNGNPEIVHSYAFCGNSIIGEAMALGDLHKVAIPWGKGRDRRMKRRDPEDHLMVRNSLSGTQKLKFSLQMAEAVLLLHSYPGGVIVHDDIQLSQFLLSANGTLKLNDFNRAEIMLWNEKDQEYCKYRNDPGHGDWRAPEEFHDDPLDEQIDIWSLGNNMYALLTGVYPFPELTESETRAMVKRGKTAFIDTRFKQRSYAEAKLFEIISLCWTYNPHHRIDIFELVDFLRTAVHENNKIQRKQ